MGPKRLVRHRNICACRLPAAFSVSCCGSMSSTSWLGSLTHDGEACDSSTFAGNLTSTGQVVHDHGVSHTFGWGVALSMVADAFIAIALCIQKHAHNINKGPDGKPVVSFLKLPIWWAGILLNVFGEAGNAYAYSLAPASVVAPVGSISVVVNEIICVTFLKEPLRRRDMVGLCAVIGGVVLVILGVPESSEELSVHHILSDDILFNPTCYWWMISLLLLIVLFTCYLEPRYAQEWILVWLLLCSSISSITVAACRSFFSLVNQVPADCAAASCVHGVIHPPCTMTLGHYLFWVLLLVIIVTAVWSAMYLNKAMMVYGNSEVVPVYYCTFTVFSITGGALIYNELGGISAAQAVMFGMGVLCAFTGVAVLMSGRAQESAAMLGGAKQLTVVPPEEEDAEAGAGGRARLAEPDHAPAPQAVPVHGQFHPEVGEQAVALRAQGEVAGDRGDTHVPGPRQHRKAQHARAAAVVVVAPLRRDRSLAAAGKHGDSPRQRSRAGAPPGAGRQLSGLAAVGTTHEPQGAPQREDLHGRPGRACGGRLLRHGDHGILEPPPYERERRRARISTGRPSR